MDLHQMEIASDCTAPVPNIDPETKKILRDYNVKSINAALHSKRFW